MIDSSVLIAAERGQLDFERALLEHADEALSISAVTATELLHGVHRANSKQRSKREFYVERLLATLPILPFDLPAARIHAQLWADLRRSGIPVGERDLMIAATAIAHQCGIVTRDERSFTRIPDLDVERW